MAFPTAGDGRKEHVLGLRALGGWVTLGTGQRTVCAVIEAAVREPPGWDSGRRDLGEVVATFALEGGTHGGHRLIDHSGLLTLGLAAPHGGLRVTGCHQRMAEKARVRQLLVLVLEEERGLYILDALRLGLFLRFAGSASAQSRPRLLFFSWLVAGPETSPGLALLLICLLLRGRRRRRLLSLGGFRVSRAQERMHDARLVVGRHRTFELASVELQRVAHRAVLRVADRRHVSLLPVRLMAERASELKAFRRIDHALHAGPVPRRVGTDERRF